MKRAETFLSGILCGLALLAAGCAPKDGVRFDADFESGALGKVERIDRSRIRLTDEESLTSLSYAVHGSFDPKNPVDTALYPSANWYYFRMTGVKGKQIYLTGVHNSVPRTSYSYDGEHWAHLPLGESDRLLLDKYFTRDTVFLALYEPYTYNFLQERLQTWTARPDVTLDTIGLSHEGRPLQLMHITDPSVPAEKKARIWIHGRQHPSETPASYLVDGLVEYLTSDTPEGKALRRQLDTYVLPFANPDGVADGLSRSNALGVNQEINFGRSDDSTVVEVKAIKETLTRLTAERPFDFLLNSHSQHAESATFWMHRGSSSSPAYFRKQWAFTGLVSSFNPCIRPLDMNFSDIAPRYVEGWSWDAGHGRVPRTLPAGPVCCRDARPDGGRMGSLPGRKPLLPGPERLAGDPQRRRRQLYTGPAPGRTLRHLPLRRGRLHRTGRPVRPPGSGFGPMDRSRHPRLGL